MQRHVTILKDLRGYHRRDPEKSIDDSVSRARPDAGDSKSDLDRPGKCINKHYLILA